MQRIFLDFETFYDDVYSLKKMTAIEYVMSPQFEALGCAFIHEGRGSGEWVDGPDLPRYFQSVDWSDTFALSHNALFDALILSMRYGIRAGFWGDTLGMARNWLAHTLSSLSLGSVSQYYGMPPKWGTVAKTKGIGFAALQAMPELHKEVGAYAIDDAGKCREIFNRIMMEGFPPGQLEIIDMVIRMATEPAFELDKFVLANHLADVKAKKAALLDAIGMEAKDVSSLMSDQQLATKLLFLGVDPIPTKVSKRTGEQAYAFAKTDKEFTELRDHPEPMVQAIVEARLGHKSTIEESRTERLIAIADVTDKLPVPLKYSGAHTHRLSGDWKINLQNLQTGGELRRAIKAPKGFKVVAIDASQIEARLNATLSGQWDLVEAFRQGRDVYAEFAEEIYHYEVNKQAHPKERFVGKQGILSLGYGSSAPVFQAMCRNRGEVVLTDAESVSIVYLYRARMKAIVDNWKFANNVILPRLADVRNEAAELAAEITGENEAEPDWGPLRILSNAIQLPSDNLLHYRDLRRQLGEGGYQWVFMRGAILQKIYGAKVVENAIQALAFIHIMEVACRVKHMTNDELWPKHQVHDELLYVVEDRYADMVSDMVVKEMSTPPIWMPKAPLAAEGHIGQTYFDAK